MRRFLFYVVMVLAAFMLQNNLFAASSIISTVPNVMLIVTFAFGFIQGSRDGMLLGFFCGLLTDLFFGTNIGFYALIYTGIGYANGLLGQVFYKEFINMPVILCIISDFIYSMYVYIFSFLLRGHLNFPYYLGHVILPEMVYTVLVTLVIYKFLLRMNARLIKMEKRSAKKFV